MNNNLTRWEQEVMALAGVAQVATLVSKLAAKGEAAQADVVACINPLLITHPDSFSDVLPSQVSVATGLRELEAMFSNNKQQQKTDIVRYCLSLLHLRAYLNKKPDMQSKISNGLQSIQPLRAIYEVNSEEHKEELADQEHTFRVLADLYQDTISTLSYRIQVQGHPDFLKSTLIANKIRALLLAGIRFAVLWQQMGGSRWRLMLYRKRIRITAAKIKTQLLN